MNIVFGILLMYAGWKLNNWYGYQQGLKDRSYRKPIHMNPLANFVVIIICISLAIGGLFMIFD